jgi:hypothetical protein
LDELRVSARSLSENPDKPVAELGRKLLSLVGDSNRSSSLSIFTALAALAGMSENVQKLINRLKAKTDAKIRDALNVQVNRDRAFIDQLAQFLDTIDGDSEPMDEQDPEEDEDLLQPKNARAAAASAFMRAVRAQARAHAQRKSLGKSTRNGKIVEWLGDRSLAESEHLPIGESLLVQGSARRFVNPIQRYLDSVPIRYRRFRRLRQSEGKWYQSSGFNPPDIDPLEVDILILTMLRSSNALVRDGKVTRNINQPVYAPLKAMRKLYRNQVLVDEATDFSPIQLACMAALANPDIQSFFACGDFNQRVTEWGSRSAEDVTWVYPDLQIRTITVSYRQSRQLNELAHQIILISDANTVDVALPQHVDNEGVAPVVGYNLRNRELTINWLARRITEIESFVQQLPSIAILVNNEEGVKHISKDLNDALEDRNIRVVACPNGQVMGQENDVRVFDIQHIKGLEFEAVFFINIDTLARNHLDLFEKYLYVGATRAATYLGVTCEGPELPQKMMALEHVFGNSWVEY